MLYFLDEILEICLTVLYTAFIREMVPVSILFVAPSGAAKSSIIRMLQAKFIHMSDSITSAGLWSLIAEDRTNEKKFILIPDINPTMSRRPAVVQSTVSNLLSLTFDGTLRVDDGRVEKKCEHKPMGFISAVTPQIYQIHAKRWFALGLRRRIIPLFYTYSPRAIFDLQNHTKNGKVKSNDIKPMKLPDKIAEGSPIIEENEANSIMQMSTAFATYLGKGKIMEHTRDGVRPKWYNDAVIPVPPHVTLRTLAQANAMRHKRLAVNQDDVNFLLSFMSFCDPETPRSLP